MPRSLRLSIAFLGFVIILAILTGGSFLLNKWLPQPATYAPSTGSPPGSLADDPVYLPDTGLVQLTSPISTTSYYITNISNLYAIGYKLGQRDRTMSGTQNDLVVLDYGLPYRESQGGGYVYGVHLPFDKNHIFYNTTAVANSAVDFANGYHDATDTTSHLTIVARRNNWCPGIAPRVSPNHVARWA